jgi:hypothetical protein
VKELNDYGRFSFVHEMQTMAVQIFPWIAEISSLAPRAKVALQLLEGELHELKSSFSAPYQRPPSEHSVALLLRCAELYLDVGIWFDLCHGETRMHFPLACHAVPSPHTRAL